MDRARAAAALRDLAGSPIPYFAALSIFLLFVHEPWRDEAEGWLIARDSPSLGSFFQAMRYEGTPTLWYLLMMPLAKLGLPFLSARILHAAIAVTGVTVLCLVSPFSRREKWLLSFGYFTAYEYDAIARSYALFSLLLFVVAGLDRRRHERPVLYGAALVLLANTTVHGLIVAALLAAAFGIEVLRGLRAGAWTRHVTAGALLVVAGLAVAAYQLRPPADLDPVVAHWLSPAKEIWNLFNAFVAAFIPLPGFDAVFWNTSMMGFLSGVGKGLLATALYAGSCWTLRGNRPVLAIYMAVTLVLAAFFLFKYYGGNHHAGLVFLFFIFCHWLARDRNNAGAIRQTAAPAPLPPSPPATSKTNRAMAWFLPVILVIQVAAAAMAVERDATGQFAGGGELAHYLEDNGFLDGKTFIAIYHSQGAHAVLAQLKDPGVRFFFPEFDRFGSFVSWSAQWRAANVNFTLDDVLARMDAADAGFDRVVLIETTQSLTGADHPSHGAGRLHPIVTIGAHVVGVADERFDLYDVARPTGS